MKTMIATCCVLIGCKADEQNLGFTTTESARWAVALGGAGEDRAMATAIDSIGDVVAAGDFEGPADFGHGPVSPGGRFGFVSKRVASDGSERWTVTLAGLPGSRSGVMGLAIDPDDAVVVAGSYVGSIDFGGTVLTSRTDGGDTFVAKYSWDGHLIWVRGLGADATTWATSITVDGAGQIYIAGNFVAGTLVLGSGSYTESDRDDDAFLAGFDPSGSLLWGHAFQGPAGPAITSIAIAPNRDVIAVGGFGGPTSLGGAVLAPDAFERGFITRFRNDGLFLASRAIGEGGAGRSIATQVAVTAADLVVIQTQDRDDSVSSSGGMYVVDANLDDVWSDRIPEHGNISSLPRALAIAPSDAILSSAWTDHPDDMTGNLEVVTYDVSGHSDTASVGNRVFGGGSPATVTRSSATSAADAAAFVGEFAGQLDFGAGAIATHGDDDTDAFIVLIDPP
jgi:hypothetical protein